MIRKINVGIAAVVLFSLLVPAGCKTARFELSSLNITPEKVATGNTATVSVELANTGTAEGTYSITLSVDGVVMETKDVTMPAGVTRKAMFAVVKDTVGAYTIEAGNLSAILHVVKPAEFKLSSLEVTPKEVLPNGEVMITVDVSNVGGLEGNYGCNLLVNGKTVQREEVTVDSGAKETVTFTYAPKYWGSYVIEIGDLSQSITVLKPAEFRISSLEISPDETVAGSSITVTARVTNIGDVEGSHTVTLNIDGESAGIKTVTLSGGDMQTIGFNVFEDVVGVHTIKINSLSRSLRITPTPPFGYTGYTDWINGFFIAYPETWEQEEEEDFVASFLGPIEEGFSANILVGIETLPYEMTAQEYFEAAEWVYTVLPDYREISTEEMQINGVPAIRSTFTWSLAIGDLTIDLKQMQVMLVDGETAFVITITAYATSYDKLAETFNTSVNSFQFLP